MKKQIENAGGGGGVMGVMEEVKAPLKENTLPKRRIIIETDGNSIHLVSAEVSGKLELVAILQNLANWLNQQK